jgi:integrase
MAAPVKTKAGTWRVQVKLRGERDAGTFNTKREADEWASRRRTEILAAVGGKDAPKLSELHNLAEALTLYKDKVSSGKKGWENELKRINAFLKHPDLPLKKPIGLIKSTDFVPWRDSRLAIIKDATLLRDCVVLHNVFEVARRDWGWLSKESHNPITDLRKPETPDHRERIIKGTEVRAMLRVMGWSRRKPVRSVKQAVAWAFLIALQTGMRQGEICAIRWSDVFDGYIKLRSDKVNQQNGREVPMVKTTRRAIEALRGWDDELVVGIAAKSVDANFRKYRGVAGLEGFTFHDTRHTAATRLAQKLHVLDLCKVFGWKNTKRALTYYNPTGKQIADRLMA